MLVELGNSKRVDPDEVAAIEYSKILNLTYITLKSGKQITSSWDHDAILQTLIPNDFTDHDHTPLDSLILSVQRAPAPASERWVGRFYVNGSQGEPFSDEWMSLVKRVSEALVGLDNSNLPEQQRLDWLQDKRPTKRSLPIIP